MKENNDIEDTTPLKSENINDLLEPLVKEEKPKNKTKKKLYESVNITTSKDYINEDKGDLHFKSIDPRKFKENDKIKKIREELNELDNETEDSSYYSNTPPVEKLKLQNFLFIIIVTIFASIQFGIFVLVFNLYSNTNNMNNTNNIINITNNNNFSRNKFYLLFLVLSWKFQIYFIFYLIYATFIFIFFKGKNQNQNGNNNALIEDSIPLLKNNSTNIPDINPTYDFRKYKYRYLLKHGSSYSSYFKIFTATSNIFNFPDKENFFQNFLNIEEIIKGISGLVFSYALFTGSYFFYFGIIYLIQSITAMIPYYIQFNFNSKNNNRNISNIDIKYFRFIFPILTSIGFYYLLKSLPYNTASKYLYILIILVVCIFSQLYTQKKFVQKSHNESPFHILFRTYFIFCLISTAFTFGVELIFNKLSLVHIFFWLTDKYLFLACFIGFGLFGAVLYNMLLTFMRIALSNNVIVKLIKYFNLVIIDLVGIFVFRQYDIINKADYFMGIILCGISLFMLDFCELL